ncbi:MAG TPA: hypothetical protein VHA07_05670 [Devosia sp.]|nr:hypothetical protein [Devosia sp.]
MTSSLKLTRLAAAAGLALAMAAAPAAPASAQSAPSALGHFFDCLGSIFDEAAHDANCGPIGDPGQPPNSGAWSFEQAPPAPACPPVGWSGSDHSPAPGIWLVMPDPCSSCAALEGPASSGPEVLQATYCCPGAYRGAPGVGPEILAVVQGCCGSTAFRQLPEVWDPRLIEAAAIVPEGGYLMTGC